MAKGPLLPPRRSAATTPRVMSPTVSHPLVDDFTLRAARMRARQHPELPVSMQLPLRVHPMWSGNNEVGNEVAFAPDDNNRQMVLKLGEWGEPRVWTGALGISHSDITAGLLAITAELEFGSGGTVQSAAIDWLEGVTFTMPFNSLVVRALYAASSAGLPSDIRLRATVGSGEKRGRSPTLSVQVPAIVTGGVTTRSAAVRVPRFARSVMVLDRSVGVNATVYSPNFSLIMNANNAGSQVGEVTGDVLLNYAASGYPLSRFANYVVLEARAPLVAVSPTLVFDIDI